MIDRPVPLLLAAIALASAAIGGAWFSELGLGYVPCMLCLWQRIPYYVAALPAIAVLALLASGRAPRATGWLALGLALIFLVSAGLGLFHAGVEWKLWAGPAGCGGRVELAAPSFQDFQKSLQKARVVLCDEAPMRLLGLSFAGWNAVVSLVVAGLFARASQLFRRA
ncbi:MAG: disulfide bond formation protein B [Rhabdaerophilum sp.]